MKKSKPRLIPVLLLDDRDLVKTIQYQKKIYLGDPVNAVNIFNENTTYQNNFGYIGALFSNSLFSYIGLSAYYFCLVNFYFGMVMFFTEPSKTFSERLTSFNHLLFSLISLFPLSLFFSAMLPDTALQISSAGINTGGVAGMNLLLILGDTLNALWLGIIGFFLFLTFQYLMS